MKTSSKVTFGLYDLDIRLDGSPSYAGDLQPFAKVSDLTTGNLAALPYATFEPDFWLLDGKYKFMPQDAALIHVGIMSLEQSGADGTFETPPMLSVDFSEPHNTDGVILHFSPQSDDYASSVTLRFLDAADAIIFNVSYAPNAPDYEIDLNVTAFSRVEIVFNATNKPHRYLRFTGLDYGQIISFSSGDIRRLEVVEEIDPLGLRFPINVCELKLYSEADLFSIFNENAYYLRLSKRQPLAVYGILDGAQVFMGQYYLDEWKNTGARITEFSCVDLTGILERTTFRGGMYYDAPAGEVIAAICAGASVPYDLSDDLGAETLTGWLSYGSCRDAIRQVAFALGAVADCSRSSVLRIYRSTLATERTDAIELKRESQALNASVELKPLQTGVELTAHEYAAGSLSLTLFDSVLEAGTHEIKFGQPARELSASGATLVESGVNYALVSVATEGRVTISGLGYDETTRVFSVYAEGLGRFVTPNTVSIEDATLVNSANGAALAQRVYDYYQMRFFHKTKMFSALFAPGDAAISEVGSASKRVQGVVEKMTTDLAGGFLSRVEIVGAKA